MREMGLKAKWIKPYTITTIDSNFSEEYKNILDEKFNPNSPDAIWCTDITYIWTYEGFVYLTSIMDLYSRKIISWVLSDTLETKWVVEAVNKAKRVRNADKPLIMHSDRGRQYTAKDYEEATSCISFSLQANIRFFKTFSLSTHAYLTIRYKAIPDIFISSKYFIACFFKFMSKSYSNLLIKNFMF